MKLTLAKTELTSQDLDLKAQGANYYEVLNHYSFSKFTAVYFDYSGNILSYIHGNTITDVKTSINDWFGREKKRFLIHVYTADSKLTHVSPVGKAGLVKE